MRITFLGTGTSHGIPVIGCNCGVCTSSDPRNARMRSSVLIEEGSCSYIIDTGQEFRLQAIRAGIRDVDAVFYTHDHADHLYGIDDLRVFTYHHPLAVYGSAETLNQIRDRFSYIFTSPYQGGGVADLELKSIGQEPLVIDGLTIRAVPIYHGCRLITGYRFASFAYLTDCSGIPESSYELLKGLDLLVIGALRMTGHPTHFSVPQAVEAIERIRPKRALLTHMCHQLEHETLSGLLPEGIEPAYDGLTIELNT